MIRSIRNLSRLLRVAFILAHYDALFLLEYLNITPAIVLFARFFVRRQSKKRPGERLAAAFREIGPAFIKLGQALATRSDLLGDEIAADLTKLQDRLSPFPFDKVKEAIETEFKQPLEALFKTFDTEPVAAASIAQVHFAVTPDGREVAVKVLRPGIEDAFARDLEMLLWIAELIEVTRPEIHRLKPVESVRTFKESVCFEMDLRFEAAAAVEFGKNFSEDPDVYIPKIDWRRTGQRVMTSERVSGIRFDHREAIITAGHDPETCVKKAAIAFFQMTFRDGLFHGDLHPGNIFVRQDGSLAIVDFGIMGHLNKSTRRYLAEILLGFLSRDYQRVAEAHFKAGWVPADKSLDAFSQACCSIAEPILGLPQAEISVARLLAQLFHVTEYFQMEVQPQLLLLQKTMLVAEGAGRRLYSDTNMWLLAQPLIEDWIARNLNTQACLHDAAISAIETLRRLPRVLTTLEKTINTFSGFYSPLGEKALKDLCRDNPRSAIVSFSFWISTFCAGALITFLLLEFGF